jgi:putative aminopeptidase FrvX
MPATLPPLNPADREQHLAWLLEISSLPTAAGHEQRVIEWIRRWAAERPHLELTEDPAGNLHIQRKDFTVAQALPQRPIYFTAHMDHPAFVVERIVSPEVVELSFRGGVMEDYFKNARVAIYNSTQTRFGASISEKLDAPMISASGSARPSPFSHYLAELDAGRTTQTMAVGDVATWDLPRAEVIDGIVHTPACDDLAALAAAISAYDILTSPETPAPLDVRLLFTRAEEIGFIGAIAACTHQTMPRDARVIALENSRSFSDSPIGGGPIVRVGDRVSVFSPSLTDAVAKRAEEVAGGPASVRASEKHSALPTWKWQRKLMAGGACEASVFCDAGYESTCVCLPLGNYHNMADLENVQAGKNQSPPIIQREFIAKSDYEGLVDLLIASGHHLPPASTVRPMVEKLWRERRFILD